jgi:hypothetical protein
MYIKNTTDTSTQRTIISFLFFFNKLFTRSRRGHLSTLQKLAAAANLVFLFYLCFCKTSRRRSLVVGGFIRVKEVLSGMTKTGVIFCSFCFFLAFCAKGNNWGLGIVQMAWMKYEMNRWMDGVIFEGI